MLVEKVGTAPENYELLRIWIVCSRHLATALMDSGKLDESRMLISCMRNHLQAHKPVDFLARRELVGSFVAARTAITYW